MAETMSSVERTLATLAFQPVDRVPVDLHNFLVTARRMGVTSYGDYLRDGEALAEGQLESWRRFGHDVLIIENGTAALAQACGASVTYLDDSAPVAVEPAIASLDEVDNLVVPDPYTDPLLAELLKATRIVVREIGDRAFIMGRGDQGPFSLACALRGLDHFMLDLALEEPYKIHRLLDFCRQVTTRYALAQIEQGAHMTSIGESPSGPDLVSPNVYRQYAWPHVARLMADLHAKGVRCAYHICGNATAIVEDMVRSGADVIEIDQKADMAVCKAAASGKSTLLGPIDPSAVLANGTPELVRERCREALAILGPGGGFILGPGCALPAITPDANIDALIESAREAAFSPFA